MGNPLAFNPFRGDPRICHGSEAMFSTLFFGTNIAMVILHLPSLLGFQPRKFNKDLVSSSSFEGAAMNCLRHHKPPLWSYHSPKPQSQSVPETWWRESHFISWKVHRQGS